MITVHCVHSNYKSFFYHLPFMLKIFSQIEDSSCGFMNTSKEIENLERKEVT